MLYLNKKMSDLAVVCIPWMWLTAYCRKREITEMVVCVRLLYKYYSEPYQTTSITILEKKIHELLLPRHASIVLTEGIKNSGLSASADLFYLYSVSCNVNTTVCLNDGAMTIHNIKTWLRAAFHRYSDARFLNIDGNI